MKADSVGDRSCRVSCHFYIPNSSKAISANINTSTSPRASLSARETACWIHHIKKPRHSCRIFKSPNYVHSQSTNFYSLNPNFLQDPAYVRVCTLLLFLPVSPCRTDAQEMVVKAWRRLHMYAPCTPLSGQGYFVLIGQDRTTWECSSKRSVGATHQYCCCISESYVILWASSLHDPANSHVSKLDMREEASGIKLQRR